MKGMERLWSKVPAAFVAVFGLAVFALAGLYLVEVSPLTKPPLGATVVSKTLLQLNNEDRLANGLAPLTENALLDRAAQTKADDEAARGYFSHTTPDGYTPLYFLNAVGYKYLNAGENLGLDYAGPEELETGWMNSPEHRANILRAVFTEAGTGLAYGTYQGHPATFAVELFATPLPGQVSATLPLSAKAVNAPAEATTTPDDANARYTASLEALIATLTKKVAELRAQLTVSLGK
jgi:hypothetical protein